MLITEFRIDVLFINELCGRGTGETYGLTLQVEDVGPAMVSIRWEKIQMKDSRYHIGWVVNYREVLVTGSLKMCFCLRCCLN